MPRILSDECGEDLKEIVNFLVMLKRPTSVRVSGIFSQRGLHTQYGEPLDYAALGRL